MPPAADVEFAPPPAPFVEPPLDPASPPLLVWARAPLAAITIEKTVTVMSLEIIFGLLTDFSFALVKPEEKQIGPK